MGDLRWYKRNPSDALGGMAVLSLEEIGAYNVVLDLIYMLEGKLKDDEKYISGWLRVDVRVWRRIRRRLIDLEKLYLHGGLLRNERADKEIDAALHRVAVARQAGLISAENQRVRRNVSNDLASTDVQRVYQLTRRRKKEPF